MAVPPWADERMSHRLPELRKQGQGENLDFEQKLPVDKDGRSKLITTVASFASSGGGIILIGVDNNGSLVGLNGLEMDEAEFGRDMLIHQIGDIVQQVKPLVRNESGFAIENHKAVFFLEITTQDAPVFYVDHRPCIRVGRNSRWAEPEEVVRRVIDKWRDGQKRKRTGKPNG